jgi:hypothetical protein
MRVRLTPFIAVLVLVSAPALLVGCHRKSKKGANSPQGGGSASSSSQVSGTGPTPEPTTSGPPPGMSESERKSIARAAYQEGLGLQEDGKCPEAVSKFEVAQKFFPAPTNTLHLAQCQATTGKLVDAAENYESLSRTQVTRDMPDAFKQAIKEAKKEGPAVRKRVPSLRINLTPAPSTLTGLTVTLNGATFPVEVIGIARPIDPGKYKVVVTATGYKEASSEVEVAESASRSVDLTLSK